MFLIFNHQDVSDLFGADLPVEKGQGGQFSWRDGPLLSAMKAGHWVVLDEVSAIYYVSRSNYLYFSV